MTTRLHSGCYFSVAAGLAAAAAMPSDAMAQCGCTTVSMGGRISKNFGPEVFQPMTFTGKAGNRAEMSFDGMYGFQSDVAPAVWFAYKPTTSASTVMSYQFCRRQNGVLPATTVTCAPLTTFTTASTAQVERSVPVTGAYSSAHSVWDRYTLDSFGPSSAVAYTPVSIPAQIQVACW
jgi:hypothetical protein